jgi:thiol-disulfide isomerase/thioredoxin
MKFYLFLLMTLLGLHACVEPNQTFQKIPPGIWRGALLLDRAPVIKYGDDRDVVKKFDFDSELPFNFEVKYDNDSTFHLIFHNATERIIVRDIRFGRDKQTAKDTVIIDFPVYDTEIRAIYEDGILEGDWIVHFRDNYRIPFKAIHGKSDRFERDNTDFVNVAGTWDCTFELGTKDEYKAVGIFNQNKDTLTGTFLTETGDFRYLEGKVIGSKIYLSAFDGSHAFLFIGKVLADGSISGSFRSGSHFSTTWEGKKDEKASLTNAYQLTKYKDSPLHFAFVNTEGKTISINDEAYKNKFKIIQIMGTWCPNCMDETVFLKEYFNKNPDPDIAIISIGFERYKDEKKSIAALQRFKQKMGISHEVLYGGTYDKKEGLQQLSQLERISSYPTMILADRNNRIYKIHTGFSGPATPNYQAFVAEFSQIIRDLKSKSN